MSVAKKWVRWLPVGALLAAAGCSQFPGGLAYPETSQSQISAARMHESRGQTAQAQSLYESTIARNPESVDAHHRLALLNARQRKWGQAEKHFLAALRTQPTNSKVLADYGYLDYCQERLLEAERTTRQALENDPENRRIANNLALIVGRQARYPESLGLFRQAGTEAQAYANIAWIYAQNGETDLATQAYARAISLDGNNRAASVAYAQLCEFRQPAAEEPEFEEGNGRRTLPPTTPRRRSNGRLAQSKAAASDESAETSVQAISLDDRRIRRKETPHVDVTEIEDQPSASTKTDSNVAPVKTHVAKKFRPAEVSAPPPPPPARASSELTSQQSHSFAPVARVESPVRASTEFTNQRPDSFTVIPRVEAADRISPESSFAAVARVEPPSRVSLESTNQPSIRSKQMAERAARPSEEASPTVASEAVLPTISVPTLTVPTIAVPRAIAPKTPAPVETARRTTISPVTVIPVPAPPAPVPAAKRPVVAVPEFVNPLAPETTPAADSAQPWAETISRTIAERPETVALPPKAKLQVAPVTVELPAARQPAKLANPVKPVEPLATVPELPALSPKKRKSNKPLKVVEPLDIKKPSKAGTGSIAGPVGTPAKKEPTPSKELAKPAELRKRTNAVPASQVTKQTKTVVKPDVVIKADESLPDMPGESAAPIAKTPAKPASKRFSFRSLITPSRKSEAETKTANLSETKTGYRPLVRRLPIKPQFSPPQATEESGSEATEKLTEKPVEKSVEKVVVTIPEKPVEKPIVRRAVVRRTDVKPIPDNDPLAETKTTHSPVRQVAHDPDLPFLSEKEPEPLPFLKADDDLEQSPVEVPAPPKQSAPPKKPELPKLLIQPTKPISEPHVAAVKKAPAPQKPVAVVAKPVPPPMLDDALPQNDSPVEVAPPVPHSPKPTVIAPKTPVVKTLPMRKPVAGPTRSPALSRAPKEAAEFDLPIGDFPTTSDANEQDIAQLIEQLRKGTPVERESAATTLGELGSLAANAIPNLVEALADTSVYTRHAARVALEKIEGSSNLSEIQQTSGNKPGNR